MFRPLTGSEQRVIRENLQAFVANFRPITIVKHIKTKVYYIFVTPPDANYSNYIQYTKSLEYINGWLYGAVQAKMGVVK